LARLTGLAMSTVGGRVDDLIAAGFLVEAGVGASSGGRRPRHLELATGDRVVAAADLGVGHARIAVVDLGGTRLADQVIDIDLAAGPEAVLSLVHGAALELSAGLASPAPLAGFGLALPGPLRSPGRVLVSGARMPGWNGTDPAEVMRELSGVPVRAENDANASAVGEALGTDGANLVLVKVGASIGAGLIVDGQLYRGANGMAGEISHTPVPDAAPVVCPCGRQRCLDVVAGGTALARDLRDQGISVHGAMGVVALAADGNAEAAHALRQAGTRTGAVVAPVVSLVNPDRLTLAGSLSRAEVFVTAVRSAVYDLCLPGTTQDLEIGVSALGMWGAVSGVASMVLDDLLSAAAVDHALQKL
jgi:predicted NBD/HSP70 family sugar kinase